MWHTGDGMGWWMVWGGLMMVLFWGGIIALIAWTVQSLTRREDGQGQPGAPRRTPPLPGSATPAATSRVRSLSRSRETWRGPDGIRTWRRNPSATWLRKEQGGPPGTV